MAAVTDTRVTSSVGAPKQPHAQARQMSDRLRADNQSIELFNEAGPYYTSYPVLGQWREDATGEAYADALREFLTGTPDAPLHLYLHIPYCAKLCWYCLCNILISNNEERIQKFVDQLVVEIHQLAKFFEINGIVPNFRELHFGGGTPSHLKQNQIRQILDAVGTLTDVLKLDELAMEVDPRTVDRSDLEQYADLGVNRISFGIQDFDARVQETINRVQPYEMIESLLLPETRARFSSVNFDLLYGLPNQTLETLAETVRLTNQLAPDRVTLLKYAHVPEVRKHMKMIETAELPPQEVLPAMFAHVTQEMLEAGYQWIGIDNFAKPDDALSLAHNKRTNGRNFGGYSTGVADNIIGVGPSSTQIFGNYYFQSINGLKEYFSGVSAGEFPISRGHTLSIDDMIRRKCIFDLQCNLELVYADIEAEFDIDFSVYFFAELKKLEFLESKSFVCIMEDRLKVTFNGRYYVKNICKIFDIYFKGPETYQIHGP
jgi:oxygen-independent coproporphyrinogen III oxidase